MDAAIVDVTAFTEFQDVAGRVEPRYRLSEEQFSFFWENGYLGPLPCDDPRLIDLPQILYRAGIKSLGSNQPIPEPSTWRVATEQSINVVDPHCSVPDVAGISQHPSIVGPVAQLLGCPQVAFLQSRFRVKFPQKADAVSWHQDVGARNGGYRADGSPVPSITVWLSVDGENEQSGGVSVLPGTHTRLWGDWRSGFHSKLEESGALKDLDLSRAVAAAVQPGEFYLFHSWTLHLTTTNASAGPRSGLVLRYVAPHDAVLPDTEYIMHSAG